MGQRFVWDETKAAENWRKHGIRFEKAMEAFSDPLRITELDKRFDTGEERSRTIGAADDLMLLLVAHTSWDDHETEIIRIISARRATPKERRLYGNRNL